MSGQTTARTRSHQIRWTSTPPRNSASANGLPLGMRLNEIASPYVTALNTRLIFRTGASHFSADFENNHFLCLTDWLDITYDFDAGNVYQVKSPAIAKPRF